MERLSPLFNLFHWFELSETDFRELYDNVYNGFLNYEYTHPGEIILFIQLMDRLINKGIISLRIHELKKCIQNLIDKKMIKALSPDEWQTMVSLKSYGNYGFSEYDENTWYEPIIKRIKDASISQAYENNKKEFIGDIHSFKKIGELCKEIQCKNGNEKYRNVAVFCMLDDQEVEYFVSNTINMNHYDFQTLISSLESRYGFDSIKKIHSVLLPEYEIICKLIKKYEQKFSHMQKEYNPHYFVLEYFITRMKKLIDYLSEKNQLFSSLSFQEQEKTHYI